ncbi:DUF3263 domain-containing protein [Rhodococcus opacus]|uniref:DUF3263 domain-containing protein n=1 Tax=Rhodococcus opacus TaxID=37919 RepID=UPI001C481D09|nr:DUF3263 domain-containing protein [Rhodococcus opacus]MBV6760262.1 DUF3263 domain-containing protein [Rhodococcus opacus]
MIGYQTEILAFAVKWAPYAGGDEQVLPTFGLSVEEYYRRLLQLLDSPAARSVDSSTITRIRHQCMQRLATTPERAPQGR